MEKVLGLVLGLFVVLVFCLLLCCLLALYFHWVFFFPSGLLFAHSVAAQEFSSILDCECATESMWFSRSFLCCDAYDK